MGASQHLASMGLMSILLTLNWIVLAWTWMRILGKKSVALAMSVIVIKYAFFAAAIVWAARRPEFSNLGWGLGLMTVFPTIAYASWRFLRRPSGSSAL
jgi:hypothetical protein